jgi:hypothetical protein
MSTVKVLVGKDRKPFDISPNVVRLTMPSIAAALNGLSEEENHNTVLLSQADSTTFEFVIQWALTIEIKLPPNDGGANSALFWSILGKVYILAEELEATKLKRYVIDTCYASIRDNGYGPGSDTIRLIYEKTCSKSGLRRIVIAFFVWQAAEGWWNIDNESKDEDDWAFKDMPECFKTEVAIATLERVHLMDDGNPFNDYHEKEETGFGPDYFYDDDESIVTLARWLRNDPNGVRAEEEWDAARFQFDRETSEDRAMINDDEDAVQEEQKNAALMGDPNMLDDDTLDDGEDDELDENDWLELKLVDAHRALQFPPTFTLLHERMVKVLLRQDDDINGYYGCPLSGWADEMQASMDEVYNAAKDIADLGIVVMSMP